MDHKHLGLRVTGELVVEIINPETGEVETTHRYNSLMSRIETYMAELLAGEVDVPGYIYVGTGALQEYALSNRNAHFELGESGSIRVAQSFAASSVEDIQDVLIGMKRLGSAGSGTVWITIEPDAAGEPSGTPVTNGTSVVEQLAVVQTDDFHMVRFSFGSPPAVTSGTYWIVIHTANYTYSDGVTELQIAIDTSSPTYTGGAFAVDDGTWGPHSTPDTDMCFRVVRVIDVDLEFLYQTIDSAPLTSLAALGNQTRLLALFATTDANDWIREMYLVENGTTNVPLAVAAVNVDKASDRTLQAYWLIKFEIAPEEV